MTLRCSRRLAGALTVGFLLLAWPASLQAQDNNPLHAVDTASPQATLRSFLTLALYIAAAWARLPASGSVIVTGPAGWNYMVRLYRPRAEVLDGKWTFPEAQPLS